MLFFLLLALCGTTHSLSNHTATQFLVSRQLGSPFRKFTPNGVVDLIMLEDEKHTRLSTLAVNETTTPPSLTCSSPNSTQGYLDCPSTLLITVSTLLTSELSLACFLKYPLNGTDFCATWNKEESLELNECDETGTYNDMSQIFLLNPLDSTLVPTSLS